MSHSKELGWQHNSVGPSKHYLVCLKDGCWCEELEKKMAELIEEEEHGNNSAKVGA